MNRFLKTTDNKIDMLGKYKIPEYWWSRKHEYSFCSDFVVKGEKVLDAGCGIEHPFKFYLADVGCDVVAIDKDEEILSIKHKKIKTMNIELKNLSSEFNVNTFDKIFCISVLEHTKNSLKSILMHFESILKENGKIIVTFDFPLLTPQELLIAIDDLNLKFVGDTNFELSEQDLIGTNQQFRVFACVLEKKNKTIAPQQIKPIQATETK